MAYDYSFLRLISADDAAELADLDGYNTVVEAARASGYSRERIYQLINRGAVPAARVGTAESHTLYVHVPSLVERRQMPTQVAQLLAKCATRDIRVLRVPGAEIPEGYLPIKEAVASLGYSPDYGYQFTTNPRGDVGLLCVYDTKRLAAQLYLDPQQFQKWREGVRHEDGAYVGHGGVIRES